MNLYTIISEFENGGTYIHQVSAADQFEAMFAWISLIEKNNEIEELGQKDLYKVNELLLSKEYDPLPVDHRINVWCSYFSTDSKNILVNIVKTVSRL